MVRDFLPVPNVHVGSQETALAPTGRNITAQCIALVNRFLILSPEGVQESLTLTRAKSYNGWNKEESQFIAEMGVQSSVKEST